jgi:hypothetical protein
MTMLGEAMSIFPDYTDPSQISVARSKGQILSGTDFGKASFWLG